MAGNYDALHPLFAQIHPSLRAQRELSLLTWRWPLATIKEHLLKGHGALTQSTIERLERYIELHNQELATPYEWSDQGEAADRHYRQTKAAQSKHSSGVPDGCPLLR